jgi:hypothetical protein
MLYHHVTCMHTSAPISPQETPKAARTLWPDVLSPLTLLPETPQSARLLSSPFPSPFPRRANKRRQPKQSHDDQTFRSDHLGNHRFIQSSSWHLSQARRQSTGYRGLHSLDPTRVIFEAHHSAKARLEALRHAGYRLVEYERLVLCQD